MGNVSDFLTGLITLIYFLFFSNPLVCIASVLILWFLVWLSKK